MKMHFISGLPRSGSTLLSCILRQNPRFTAGVSSPVAGLVSSVLKKMSMAHEASVFINDGQRKAVVHSIFDVFYPYDPEMVAFDTHRSWCARMTLLSRLYPECKVICCVRDVEWVFDSIEQLAQKNYVQPSSLHNYSEGGTVYSRMDGVAGGNGLVGYALNALREACYGPEKGRLLLLRYETLTRNPRAAMQAVYKFIGEPDFEHDFNNVKDVQIEVDDFDSRLGTPGLHAVRKRVTATVRPSCLPPDLFERYQRLSFWNGRQGIPGLEVV